jgi:tripartite-type tricarboxylate transporter receptor subunit TctC
MHRLHVILIALALALTPSVGFSQAYPNKPVKVIVTFPPGGTPDIYGRVLSQELSNLWKQAVVVENKAGASGTIGTDFVAKATPDGYTLLFAADASITIAPLLYSKNPYDPVRDLAPIVNAAAGPFVILAHPSFPANNIKELLALAKAQPGKLSYASSGAGGQQHLTMETIKSMGGIDMLHIPYKGFGQGVTDVLANQVPLIVGGITASIGLTQSGKLKALGITGTKRSNFFPNVGTIAETLPGFEITAWYGFMAPAGTPRELISKINEDVVNIIKRPDFQARLARDAIDPVGNTPEQFAAQIKTDLAMWTKIVKAAGAKLD